MIHAQVDQTQRGDRARNSAACAHYLTAVRVCMPRRLDENSVSVMLLVCPRSS
jgi:hypothetical protein